MTSAGVAEALSPPLSPEPAPRAHSVIVFAPTGNDARVTAMVLDSLGKSVLVCTTMAEVCREAEAGCDVILLAEETLNAVTVGQLAAMLERQPAWSDVPITIITSGGEVSQERLRKLAALGAGANVTLLERPFRKGTLLSSVEVAARARSRQYQVRDLLAERQSAETMLAGLVEERTAQLTESNSQLETLVYSIAHDLRAPLRSMQAFAKILLEDYAPRLDKDAEYYAQRIVKSAETLDVLVLDLLAYGKVSRSEMPLHSVSVEAAWQGATFQFEEEIVRLQAAITVTPPLPEVCAHYATLSQVLANLLGNALKFTAPGVAPQVTLRARRRGDRVRIEIEDNGVGIPEQYHDRIFRVFERLQNSGGAGTGIGLSIVRKGVERMGGSVGLESGRDGRGTRFWIDLPAAKPV